MKKILNKKLFIILPVIMAVLCAVVITACGKTYHFSFDLHNSSQSIEDYEIYSEHDHVRIDDAYIQGSKMYITVSSVSEGRDYVTADTADGSSHFVPLIVHRSGIITQDYFIGNCSGSWIIAACVAVYLVLVLISLILKYRRDTAEDLYRYKNISTFGLIVFLAFLIIMQITQIFSFSGLYNYMSSIISSAGGFSLVSFPIVFIISILIIFSNINLMRREGRNLRNMMGIILCVLLCVLLVLPSMLSDYIFNYTNADVHDSIGVGNHIVMFAEEFISSVSSYLICMLAGTIVVALRAARHIPSFDKDYIIILGCMITKDGGLTKLLQGRVDRALEFAKMQKEASGRDIVFVPSGGKGSNEVIAEAEAISNYLISQGIPESRILIENRSANTFENLKFSNELIRKHCEGKEPGIAFSTTNYHVFRAGMYASKQGIKAEGIGSRTKRYFWVNAFIREFVATLSSERKTHISIIAGLFFIILIMVVMMYLSVQI